MTLIAYKKEVGEGEEEEEEEGEEIMLVQIKTLGLSTLRVKKIWFVSAEETIKEKHNRA